MIPRLPTLRQLERMGPADAGRVLDLVEQEWTGLKGSPTMVMDGHTQAYARANAQRNIRRVQKRREEYFGPERPHGHFGGGHITQMPADRWER